MLQLMRFGPDSRNVHEQAREMAISAKNNSGLAT
jgi:hypothetical protein